MTTDYTDILLDQNPDALIIISIEGRILSWNRSAETVFGYTSKEAVGGLLNDLITPVDRMEETEHAP